LQASRGRIAFSIVTGLLLAAGSAAAAPPPQPATSPPAKPAAAQPTKPAAAQPTKPADKKQAAPQPDKKAPAKKPAAPAQAAKPGSKALARVPIPRPNPRRPVAVASADAAMPVLPGARAVAPPVTVPTRPAAPPAVMTPAATTLSPERAAVARVIEQARRGRPSDATEIANTLADPLARKLAEWVILRSEDSDATFERYAAFVASNPTWPSTGMLRRRAESHLWEQRRDPAIVRAYFASNRPVSAKGHFALARAALAYGDRRTAEMHARDGWRNEPLSRDLEATALEAFGELLTRADHKARMDIRLYAEDFDGGQRMAQRLGGNEVAIAKARVAVMQKAANAKALLDAVPAEARRDVGYTFNLVQWLRRNERIEEAVQLVLAAPRDPAQVHDTDQWWVERRLLSRKLLDTGDFRAAYRIAADAAPPERENYRIEHQFTAGWIALRVLNDPATALGHFSLIDRLTINPISLARAGYWTGRASEALGRRDDARAYFTAAARHSTAYYGVLARARLGLPQLGLQAPPDASAYARAEVVRAADILYSLGERDLAIPFVIDAADKAAEPGVIIMLGEVAKQHEDARGMLLIGKAGLARGYALDLYAFPALGVPSYSAIGPSVDRSLVYSIVRQESQFNPRVVSTAKAMGLMQVTPAAGKFIAKKYGATYDQTRLLKDNVYNVQMGAAELGGNIEDYRGSYILAFAAYNAGRGRVKEWIERYGDPRDGKVDPVDWVERIPFSETRNYVQRVMETLQVYRARFGGDARLLIETDMRRGALN
jgi:soluble lytic murein transglycosylase